MADFALNKAVPYSIDVDDELLEITKQKLAIARYPEELGDVGDDDWDQGAKVKEVQRLADYWRNGFDWKAHERAINEEFNSFKVRVDVPNDGSIVLHYAHHASSRPNAIPLIIVHGWPGSFLESRKLLVPLTEPSDPSIQAFHVVVPSIPGYGPGDAPTTSGFGPAHTARAFTHLMVDALGYKQFGTSGGDWGSLITRSMAKQYPQHVRASHHNGMFCGSPPLYKVPLVLARLALSSFLYSEMEREALKKMWNYFQEEGGYMKIQSTRPQSLGFGLGDSPVGLLGWLVEKYHNWVDVEHYNMPDDEFLTFVMMHWMRGPTPGLRYYKAAWQEIGDPGLNKAFTTYINTPVGVSIFPKEVINPPRDWMSYVANIQYWKEHTSGGHFPNVECPANVVDDLRHFFSLEIVKLALKD
ncbi:MAG: hypothetical protein Q9223_002028 [Gallowayella weberi]